MGPGFQISVYLNALWRKLWLVLFIFIAGSLIAASVAVLLPPVFRSTATILVQSQQIPDDLARSTVTNGTEERLSLIRQRLMTRENLLLMAVRLGLYADRPDLSPTTKAERLRAATTIVSVPLDPRGRGSGPVSSLNISFVTDEAVMAARVTNEFVSLVLEENLRNRIGRATETSSFFKGELTRIERALADVELQIAGYKRENEATLPETLSLRREEMARLKERSFEITREVIDLEEEKRTIELALEDEGNPITIAPVTSRQMSRAELELSQLEAEYRAQRVIFAENHPRMRILRSQIEAAEKQVAAETALTAAGEQAEDVDSVGEEPSRENRLARMQAAQRISEIDRQLELLDERRANIVARETALIASIQTTPQIEMQLSSMTRERVDLEAQYEEVVAKLAEAEIGELLEVNRQSERFEVIEPGEVPIRPEKPNRILILVAGVFGSLVLGVGTAVGLEMLNRSIRTPADLERALQIPAFAVVPYFRTAAEVRLLWLSWIVGIGFLLGAGAGAAFAVDRYYLPLDLVLEKVVDRTGVSGIVTVIKDRIDR